MGKEWLQLALKMAENARIGIAEELKQERTARKEKAKEVQEQQVAVSSR